MEELFMRRALLLAEKGAGRVSPNPMVGCVITQNGKIVGEGWHREYGGLHAERNALTGCAGHTKGATLYVTLEPCCHQGKTPPCTEAILAAGIGRVVIGCLDPNPVVAGKGMECLKLAGIKVELGLLEPECKALNEVFFHYIKRQMPFVVMKYAMTLDGKLASAAGDSQWITGERARAHVHATRSRLRAIMVGIGTVLSDDPLLTSRIEGGRDPLRIVCDSRLRIPLQSRILQTACQVPTLVASIERNERAEDIEAVGAEILLCAEKEGRVDMRDLMRQLGARGIDSVLLEGGSELQWAALDSGVVQRVQAYIAPRLIGGGSAPSPIGGAGIRRMAEAVKLREVELYRFDDDYLIEGVVSCSPES